MTLYEIEDVNLVRIVLTYPGGTDQVVCPNDTNFRRVHAETSCDSKSFKLNTTCFISHSSWTDPAALRIGVYLAVPNLFDHTLAVDSPEKLVSISETVKIVIHPKPTVI